MQDILEIGDGIGRSGSFAWALGGSGNLGSIQEISEENRVLWHFWRVLVSGMRPLVLRSICIVENRKLLSIFFTFLICNTSFNGEAYRITCHRYEEICFYIYLIYPRVINICYFFLIFI